MRTFTVDEYHRMIQVGILGEDDDVELLEGYIVPKMPHNPPHDGTIQVVNKRLLRLLPPGWDVRVQSALTLPDSEPEPDLAVVRGDERIYLQHHPGPADVGLVVEVADSSLDRDRDDKGRLYARAGVGCYWIVNLVNRQVEAYTAPSGPGPSPAYARQQTYGIQDSVPLSLDGQLVANIPVRELLP
jgi:Uma2 family endonuclease